MTNQSSNINLKKETTISSVVVVEGGMILHFYLSFCFLIFDILFSEKPLITMCFNTSLSGLTTKSGGV
jgi:thiosulfate reductase cytochrome b subunit